MHTGSLRLRLQHSRRALYQAGRLLCFHSNVDYLYRLAGRRYSDDNCLLSPDAYPEKARGCRYSVSWLSVSSHL